jgi:hypothetical protein
MGHLTSLQEITASFTKNFNKKKPPYGFFALMSNLTKMPFWTSQFGLDRFDYVFLVVFFLLGFLTKFFLLNHRDNNIIWAMTKYIYYLFIVI